jgi:dTDP-4-amino-4,6-dideoxygalactose transaminase
VNQLSSRWRVPLFRVATSSTAEATIASVVVTESIAAGPHLGRLEAVLRDYIGNPLVLATGEFSGSLTMALFLAGVRPGDSVALSPMICLATSSPVATLFAKTVWCDVDPTTGCIDADDLSRRILPNTKAVIVYHWAGNPSDLDRIYAVARQRGLMIIEDASEALGAEYGSRKLGNTGADFTVFSFYPNRHMHTIDGAAIAFGAANTFERGQWLRRYGIHRPSFRGTDGEISPTSDIPVAGWSCYMNEVAAALGVEQAAGLPGRVDRHRKNGEFYDKALQGVPGITLLQRAPGARSAHWVYTLLAEDRPGLIRKLHGVGVAASQVHIRNDVYTCFERPSGPLPGVDYFDSHTVSIPSGWWVTDQDRDLVAKSIREGW